MSERPRVLIQCIGNRLRRDDGAGPAVADRLREAGLPAGIEVQEHWGEGTELMRHWPGIPRVILVDAASSGAEPGTVHHFDALRDPVPAGLCYHSTHRFGVAEAIGTARALGQLPDALDLYAIEGADFGWGEGLSSVVAVAVPRVALILTHELLAKTPLS